LVRWHRKGFRRYRTSFSPVDSSADD
jgi:hypothetical protein